MTQLRQAWSLGLTQPAGRGRGAAPSPDPFGAAGSNPQVTPIVIDRDASGRATNLPCQRPPWGRLVAVNANPMA